LFVPASNGCQDGGQIAVGLNPIEFAGLDQGRDDGPVLCACVMTCEECVFAVEGNGADRALDRIAVDFDAAIFKETA
jgi:hypothetical protein